MTVTVFYSDGSVLPMPYTVTVLKNGCCNDLSMALGTACCLSSDESLLLAEVLHLFLASVIYSLTLCLLLCPSILKLCKQSAGV